MASGTLPVIHTFSAEQSFAVAAFLQVHGEDDRGRAGSFGALNKRPANLPDVRGIQLLPHRTASCGSYVLDRRSGDGGEHHKVTLGARCPGNSDFAFGMEGFLSAYWREHNRRVGAPATQSPPNFAAFNINKPAWSKMERRIAFALLPRRSPLRP